MAAQVAGSRLASCGPLGASSERRRTAVTDRQAPGSPNSGGEVSAVVNSARKPEKVSPPGVLRSRPLNTARGTPKVWRTCGLSERRSPAESAVPLRCREASRSAGLTKTPVSRAPSSGGDAKRRRAHPAPAQNTGRRSVGLAGNKNEMAGIRKECEAANSLHLPLEGGGRSAKQTGRG
jgi:hypothetical protein